jgi:predicted secreted protein
MGVFEAIVVFVMVWWLIFLPILSMGVQSQQEAGEIVPGSERAAPVRPNLVPKLVVATLGAALLTGLLALSFALGWVSLYPPPA